MNEALQTLEVKVENNGTTPQGKIFAREWNVMVEAVKALDLKEFDEAKLRQFLRDNDFITSEDIPDVDFSNVVTLSGRQTISGAKDFVGGIKVNGMPLTYNAELGVWEFKGDVVVTGAITMFGSLSGFQPSTVTEAVEVDGETIVKTKNSQGQWQLTAIGGGSGTGGGISAAEVNILISNALEPYALSTSIPTDNKQLLNGAGYATVGDLDTRINNLINGAPAAYDTLKEIADVLAGNVNSIGDILTALDTKATKTYVDTELTKYVKLATAQSIEAQHNFVNGLQIGGLPITKSASANNTIYLDANLVVSGAITMFGSGSTTFPTIWANIPFDLNTMEWTGSVWRVKGDGTGSVDDATVRVIVNEVLGEKGYATEKWVTDKDYATVSVVSSAVSSALVGYATESFVTSRGYITSSALNGLASQSWVSDNYLSKSGGTVNGSITAVGNIYLGDDGESMLVMNRDFYNRFVAAKAGGRFAWRVNGQIDDVLVLDESGYLRSPIGFVGNLTGNADSADVLKKSFANEDINYGAGDGLKLIYCHGNPGSYATAYQSGISVLTDYAGWQLTCYGGVNIPNPYFRQRDDAGIWRDWHQLAFLTDNVASATKLQTPRSIWGQSFDGSGDITGPPSFPRYININRDATSGAIIDSSALGCEIETYSSHIAIKSISNDGFYIPSQLCLIKGGNVAVGGATADARLHVHGTTILGGDTTINGNLLTTGVITMFSQLSMKNVIDYDGLSLAQLAQIRPARFTWKDGRDNRTHVGGIADYIYPILPEVVYETVNKKLTVDYGSAAFYIGTSLIKPVIELWEVKDKQQEEIESLKKRVEHLENENRQLRAS